MVLLLLVAFVPNLFAEEGGEYSGFTLGIERIPVFDDAWDEFSTVSPFDFEIGFTLANTYMWRGQRLGRKNSLQPWVTISPDFEPFGDFSVNLWANVTSSAEPDPTTELDYTFSYVFNFQDLLNLSGSQIDSPLINFDMDVGYIYYTFPDASGPSDDSDSREWYFGLTWGDILLSPSFYLYHDFGGATGGRGTWMEFGISHDVDVQMFTVSTYATLGYNHQQWAKTNTSTFSTLDFGASIPIPIGTHMTLEPFLSYTLRLNTTLSPTNADLTQDQLYGGLNYTLTF